MTDRPRERHATVDVLTTGYVGGHVASTVALIRDDGWTIIVDPGMVRDRALILDPLKTLGVDPDAVTDVVFSHHHPDHTINAALFRNARYHDHWAIYDGDLWTDSDAEGREISPSVTLIRTPGHTLEDITTLAGTPDGIVAFTHVWWHAEGPAEDRYAENPSRLHASRARVRSLADLVVPGHGAAFTPSETTPA